VFDGHWGEKTVTVALKLSNRTCHQNITLLPQPACTQIGFARNDEENRADPVTLSVRTTMPAMTLKALVVAGLLSAAWPAATVLVQERGAPARDVRLERVEQWLNMLLHHNPGSVDAAVIAVGKWSSSDLQNLYVDATAIVRMIRNPGLASENSNPVLSVEAERGGRAPRPVRYNRPQLVRLKQIACAVGGLVESAPCQWTATAIADDAVLSSLSSAANAVRRDMNANFIVRRGALAHSDIAMLGLAAPEVHDYTPGRESVRMSFADGRQTALIETDLHWDLARGLMDLVAGPGTMKPAPAGDAMVHRWYIATVAWMQQTGHHDNVHVGRGRQIFPDDPDLAMLDGAQHETYASAAVQTAVRSAVLPTGVKLVVGSERSELREAEKSLRRATELKPDFAEAQIRLGRVLHVIGRATESVEHLTKGIESTEQPLLQYFGSLFLGAAEAELGHRDAAKAAYERAAAIYPRAQSPLLGLSELARRAGHREEALEQMERVYRLQSTANPESDPWWTYGYEQGRDADSLIEAMQKPFRLTDGK